MGLIYIYFAVIIGALAVISIAALSVQGFLDGITRNDLSTLSIGAVLFLALVAFSLSLITNIYRHNSLIITDKETVQVLQRGVFQMKVSHLSHADIEDITSERNGLLPTIFNYGTLHIETSGELKNFAFTYCPDPDAKARIVLAVRQRFTESSSG